MLNLGLWLEGDPDAYKHRLPGSRFDVLGGAKELDVRWAATIKDRFGDSVGPGIFGAISTGVISYADIQANYNGFLFYKALAADPYNYRFRVGDIPLAILKQWNEQINRNRFVGDITVDDTLFPPKP
jgi:hypothetical protein